MIRKLIILSAIVFTLSACNSGINCSIGSGPIVSQEIDLATFNQINFEVAGNVTIIESTEQKKMWWKAIRILLPNLIPSSVMIHGGSGFALVSEIMTNLK